MASKMIRVANQAELVNALKAARGGEIIELAAGNYGDLRLGQYGTALTNSSKITIQSADPAHPANFSSIRADHVSNVAFNKVSLTTPYVDPLRPPIGLYIVNSHGIAFQNGTITGPIVTPEQANAARDAYAGAAYGTGISTRFSTDVMVTNNVISQFETAASGQRVDNLQFNNNEVHSFSNDAFDGATLTRSSISGNYFHDPKGSDQSTLHPDFIQIWTDGETTNSHDVNINNNIFVNNSTGGGGEDTSNAAAATPAGGNSQFMQTILLQQKNANPAMDYQNISISNNLIFGNQLHAAYVQNGHNLTINNNTIISNNDGTDPNASASVPGVDLVGRISDAVIRNNVTPTIIVPGDATNVTQSGNYLTNQTDPSAPNYVGKLFVDTFGTSQTDYSQGDLKAVPGSVVATRRLGSSLTWNLNDIAQPVLYVDMQPGTGLDRQTFDYDATALFKSPVDLTGARISLDFGDGSDPVDTFQGSHTYADAGIYDVTADIRLANGQTITGTQGVRVQSPVVLDVDFDHGLVDDSTIPNAVTPTGASLVRSTLGQSLHLASGRSYLTFGRSYDTTANEALTVSFDFKKDHAGDGGVLFQQARTTSLTLTPTGQLSVVTADADGHSFAQKDLVSVADTNWHQVTVTLDGAKGVADYYMDGRLVGAQSGYTAGQVTNGNWAPTIGSPWNASLVGSYDNVQYLSGAMSGAQVAQSWAALQQQLQGGGVAAGATSSSIKRLVADDAGTQAGQSSLDVADPDALANSTPPATAVDSTAIDAASDIAGLQQIGSKFTQSGPTTADIAVGDAQGLIYGDTTTGDAGGVLAADASNGASGQALSVTDRDGNDLLATGSGMLTTISEDAHGLVSSTTRH